jgi:hypothetical protein
MPSQSPPVPAPAASPSASLLPSTGDMDKSVLRLVSGLSSKPDYASWLKNSDLTRRFVAVVDTIADGRVPHSPLSFLTPSQPFAVRQHRHKLSIDPASYDRYNVFADTLDSLDTKGAANVYRQLHPLLESVYKEIGKPGTTLDGRFALAIQTIESAPVLTGPVRVEREAGFYKLADAKLESLSPAVKQLIRMGPQNTKAIQAKLRQISEDFKLPIPMASSAPKTAHAG